jgi:hypothetical protein
VTRRVFIRSSQFKESCGAGICGTQMSTRIPTTSAECRGQISLENVGVAIVKLGAMDLAQKEQLADEIVREQQALFTSFLVQKQFGVSYEKMEFLLNILFVCFLAMKESGVTWRKITDDDVDVCMTRYVESVKFGMDQGPEQSQELLKQFIAGHPEQALLAYVQGETADWLKRITPEDSDRYVMLAAANMVNCIGYTNSTGVQRNRKAAKVKR